MFKPKTLSEAIELARIRDESVDRQRRQNKADQPQTNKATLSEQSVNPTNTLGPTSQTNGTVSTKKFLRRNCKGGGKKGYTSITMKSSHQDIVVQLYKPLSLNFVHIKNS